MKSDFDWQAVAQEEVEFFGNVSAAISHEINNRLAVISEKAGLIEDLARMLARGKSVDPVRLEVQGQKIVEQVRLAKKVVKNLNRFAHSVDGHTSRIDASDLLGFVVELYARKAAMAKTTLSVSRTTDSVVVTTSPFVLENLVGRCIDFALTQSHEAKAVDVGVEATQNGIRVRFGGFAGMADTEEFFEPRAGMTALLASLGASLRSDTGGTALFLDIPDQEISTQRGTP